MIAVNRLSQLLTWGLTSLSYLTPAGLAANLSPVAMGLSRDSSPTDVSSPASPRLTPLSGSPIGVSSAIAFPRPPNGLLR